MMVGSNLVKPADIKHFSNPAMPLTVRGKYKYAVYSNSLTFSPLFRQEMRLKRQHTIVETRKRFAPFALFCFMFFRCFFVYLLSRKSIEILWEKVEEIWAILKRNFE